MDLNRLGIVTVGIVFPGTKYEFNEFKKLLQALNRTEALLWCCGLNCMVSHPYSESISKNVNLAVANVFDEAAIKLINSFGEAHGSRPIVIFRGQLFELIRWICLFSPNDPQTDDLFNDSATKAKFAKALLMSTEIWSERIQQYNLTFDKDDISQSRIEHMPFFRQLSVSFNRYKRKEYAISRGYELFARHFRRRYENCDEKFKQVTKMTLEEYFASLCLVVENYLRDGQEKIQSFLFHRDVFWNGLSHKRCELEEFVTLSSQTVNELSERLWKKTKDSTPATAPKFNHTVLRNAPLIMAIDGRMIILDPMFLLEKAAIGPLFAFASLTRGMPGNREPFDTFGVAFEDYAEQSLQTAFSAHSAFLAKRFVRPLEEKNGKTKEIIDACLNNYDKAVLIEIKSLFLKEEDVLDDDPDTYKELLLGKYDHGLDQLATAIKKLDEGDWEPAEPHQDFSAVKTVYPVLLVHDMLFDSPTQTDFLSAKFKEKLAVASEKDNGYYQVGRFDVVPLIILTIDVLEGLENSLREFDFIELLNDYHRSTPQRIEGLFDFIGNSDKYKGRLWLNERLLGQYKDVQTMTLNFAEPTHEQIAIRAFVLWELSGQTHGHDLDDWFAAKRALSSD